MAFSMRPILPLLLILSSCANATDNAREQRWIDQTIDTIFDGEPIFLDAAGHRFLSIYLEPEIESVNGLIVMHGTGFHPNVEEVIQPLRIDLATRGWHTLSIQLPLLSSEAEYGEYVAVYPEVPPRLEAATHYLESKGVTNIGIVAHSQGATMASYYVASSSNNVVALVAIGMPAQHTEPHINSAESLKHINIPVLDLYGSKDFPSVLATSSLRESGAAHNVDYQQLVIDGAYHFFEYREDELLDSVGSWLETYQIKQ